ncbi:L-xylulose reductase-like [Ruditapes philippinarum]|uniref:L-xylulose reductase-like n=1 Tax=Ruditapes philippinarum TaxID=129788 RepID=UPI00295B07DB|nr:L-xylulose reductase-like [Ruditapes philippinarum]
MAFNLAGKKFLVTGAGRGIGRQLSKTLSEQGCKVYALSKTKETLDSLAAECDNVKTIHADVGVWEETREKLKDIEVLDGLVNNAAYVGENLIPALDVSKEYLTKIINANLLGTINTSQIIGRKMVDAKKPGSIVNISSIWSLQAVPENMPYTVSKCAIDMVTKQFALELGPFNIRVNAVNPTLVLTESIKKQIEEGLPLDKLFLDKTPLQRIPEISEIINPILYLLSEYSSMVSGTINIVDGGLMSSFTTKM